MILLGDFVVKYGVRTAELSVPTDNLYQVLVDMAENMPLDWYTIGHQNTTWKMFRLLTQEVSQAWEYTLGDFAVCQAAIVLDKNTANVANVMSNGFLDFAQQYLNGIFAFSPPNICSPVNLVEHLLCMLAASSWEYSFFAPYSISTLIGLMGMPVMFIWWLWSSQNGRALYPDWMRSLRGPMSINSLQAQILRAESRNTVVKLPARIAAACSLKWFEGDLRLEGSFKWLEGGLKWFEGCLRWLEAA
ncbi:hypothetical protein DFH08DRAFT_821077 [Mycena albidolilacea]|uniref:Glycosyl hydrolase family 92 domain-containing protein n=1 Tax=Mycena albidolilacea TaxID=1033008 RepID=A0AAD6ZBH0_9AGAR|nr:hypothetical protein DFH08DRAFT_821077 [Mycena albidolilacea]